MKREIMLLIPVALLAAAAGCHKSAGLGGDSGGDADADADGDTDEDTETDTETDTGTWPAGECPEGFTCFPDIICDSSGNGRPDVDWTWLGVLGGLPGEVRHPDEFTVHDDGVTDEVTGLTWQRCSYPGTGSGPCPPLPQVPASQLEDVCEETYGPNWRLPTVSEITTLLDFSKDESMGTYPAIETEVFPYSEGGSTSLLRYATGTWRADKPEQECYRVNFSSPACNLQASGCDGHVVRCVLDWGGGVEGVRFAVDPAVPEEVLDLRTGLTWMRCGAGQEWDGGTCAGDASLVTHAEAEAACAGEWRLPTIVEAITILNRCYWSPSVDSAAFPGVEGIVKQKTIWTSTLGPHPTTDKRFSVNLDRGWFAAAWLWSDELGDHVANYRCVK